MMKDIPVNVTYLLEVIGHRPIQQIPARFFKLMSPMYFGIDRLNFKIKVICMYLPYFLEVIGHWTFPL